MNTEGYETYRATLQNLKSELGAAPGRLSRSLRHAGLNLDRVEAALRRLDRGSYGYCQKCFLVIPQAELLRRPYEERCRNCQSRAEGPRPIPRARMERCSYGVSG